MPRAIEWSRFGGFRHTSPAALPASRPPLCTEGCGRALDPSLGGLYSFTYHTEYSVHVLGKIVKDGMPMLAPMSMRMPHPYTPIINMVMDMNRYQFIHLILHHKRTCLAFVTRPCVNLLQDPNHVVHPGVLS